MFSETVDRIVERSKRPDRVADIASYLNSAIRELHSTHELTRDSREISIKPDELDAPKRYFPQEGSQPAEFVRESYSAFDRDIHRPENPSHVQVENNLFYRRPDGELNYPNANAYDQYGSVRSTAHGHGHNKKRVYVWQKPPLLFKIGAIRYDHRCFSQFMPPGRNQRNLCDFHYFVEDKVVFVGWHRVIDVYYFEWAPHFKYYAPNARPAIFDRTQQRWLFLTGSQQSPEYKPWLNDHHVAENLIKQVSDWTLVDWNELLVDMALVKLYASLSDPRAADLNGIVAQSRDGFNKIEIMNLSGFG